MNRFREIAFFLLRVFAGFEFLQHGLQKTFGMFGGYGPHSESATGIYALAGYIELVAGSLIILGLLTRPAAFIASGEMAVAYFKAHVHRGFFPIMNHGELPVLFCFVFLYLVAVGAGPWSLDAMLPRKSRKNMMAAEDLQRAS
jgi:putative oxidoreductase